MVYLDAKKTVSQQAYFLFRRQRCNAPQKAAIEHVTGLTIADESRHHGFKD